MRCFRSIKPSPSTPPLILQANADTGTNTLVEELLENKTYFQSQLYIHGAIVIRGFDINDQHDFERVCRSINPKLLSYIGGGIDRTAQGGEIYTSTDYPAAEKIPQHIEACYLRNSPKQLFFFCETPCQSGGQTPIADMNKILDQIDPAILNRFKQQDLCYISNLHGGNGFGQSWMEIYATDAREVAEERIEELGCDFEWLDNKSLRVKSYTPALRQHSHTGLDYWANQAVTWHPSWFGSKRYAVLKKIYGNLNNFPKSVCFANGEEIIENDIQHIRDILDQNEVVFKWEKNDILVIDNQRISHGRQPFCGDRKILVALA
ncbi:MAG: TauD/TfdA family dioxygenase [Halioglobus sp.]|nr:TauD/TfdA family dioxygenase [Halioglobus sp.]